MERGFEQQHVLDSSSCNRGGTSENVIRSADDRSLAMRVQTGGGRRV